jgi:RNA polymerase sigma-70 factor (ECF subfamily)
MPDVTPDSAATQELLEQAARGDQAAFQKLAARHRAPLRQLIADRLDPRLARRLDVADVEQDVLAEAYARLADFLERRPMPFRLWLLRTARDRVLNLHRDHITAARRSVRREAALPEHSSAQLAERLLASGSTPSQQAARQELTQQMRQALAALAEEDREILLLRYVDGLSNQEVAAFLEITPAAASKRHGRALVKLHKILKALGLGEADP